MHAEADNDESLKPVHAAYIEYLNGKREKPTAAELINSEANTVQNLGTDAESANNATNTHPLPPTRDALLKLIDCGRFFLVTFTKRTTG